MSDQVIDWQNQPKQCGEFKVLDIGEYDRCAFVEGHSGPHSFGTAAPPPEPNEPDVVPLDADVLDSLVPIPRTTASGDVPPLEERIKAAFLEGYDAADADRPGMGTPTILNQEGRIG